jgi:hypothetical protein
VIVRVSGGGGRGGREREREREREKVTTMVAPGSPEDAVDALFNVSSCGVKQTMLAPSQDLGEADPKWPDGSLSPGRLSWGDTL